MQVPIHRALLLPDIPNPAERLGEWSIFPLGCGVIHIDGSTLVQSGSLCHRTRAVTPAVAAVLPKDAYPLDQTGFAVNSSGGNRRLFGESHIPIVTGCHSPAISTPTKWGVHTKRTLG
jgi:hypothetical protein